MKSIKKALCVLLAATLMISCAVVSGFSAQAEDKIVIFNSYTAANRSSYGDAPEYVQYEEDGSVTLISEERWARQHQALWSLDNKEKMAEALALAQGDEGDGTLQIAVTIKKCSQKLGSGTIESDKAAEINVDLNVNSAAVAAGKSSRKIQTWQNCGTTKYYRFDCIDYTADDFTSIRLNIMNYAVSGGCGDFEINFTPVFASADGSVIEVSSLTLPTVDPSIKTSPFLTFSRGAKNDYGNPPDSDTYDEGGVTIKSINTKNQHQLNFKFNKETVNTALAIANREDGTGKVKFDVTVLAATDDYGRQGYCEIVANLFVKADNNGYTPPSTPSIQFWQEVGTTATYYLDVSQIKSADNCSNLRIAVQNYWYYNDAYQLIESPWNTPGEYYMFDSTGKKVLYEKPESEKLRSAQVAPTVYFSNIVVAETYEEQDYYFPGKAAFVYGDANSDSVVNTKDVLTLRQYLAMYTLTNFNEAGADANADGVVNAKDLLLVRQYIAEWPVHLGKQ